MKEKTENGFVRHFEITPAFDKRNPDPSKNYGIHGMDFKWVLVGPKGATQFEIFTNWQLPHVQKELERKKETCLSTPIPADWGFHSPIPQYEEAKVVVDDCTYLGGKPCYYDGSGLRARDIYNEFTEKGEDWLWGKLLEYYNELFKAE